MTLAKAYSQTLVELNTQANSEELAQAAKKTLADVKENLHHVRSGFKEYLGKVRKFTGI